MRKSWIDIPAQCDFSLDNIPFGICSFPSSFGDGNIGSQGTSTPRVCTAIGNYAVDLHLLAEAGLLDNLMTPGGGIGEWTEITTFHPRIVFSQSSLNEFMACEKNIWVAVRNRLISLFIADGGGDEITQNPSLQNNIPLQTLSMHLLRNTLYHLPATIGDYTDFYSSREHATNVGIMFRGKDNALQPNWLHMPIGYHGRSSSVFPSLSNTCGRCIDSCGGNGKMSTIRRPCGQLQIDPANPMMGSTYGPCKLMDFELEVAFFVGGSTNYDTSAASSDNEPIGKPLTLDQASDRIFGYVLMNDWSARDIQKWEYVPLGPFTAKNFATTIRCVSLLICVFRSDWQLDNGVKIFC